MRVLVTGANGFVGCGLMLQLVNDGRFICRAATRGRLSDLSTVDEAVRVGSLAPDTDWSDAVKGVEVVIHAAARVHIMRDKVSDQLAEFRKINVDGTLRLARQAADAGVRRFIFVSSIKVNGENTCLGRPFGADSPPAPIDPYGISKMEAENKLQELAVETGMEVVTIRPPLVYGPGVKANFLAMMRWLYRGIPLPFGAIHNRRSLVALDNLVDLIVTCINHPSAANQTFLVSDGEDLSTTELLYKMGSALGKSAKLLPVPVWIITGGAILLRSEALLQRLCDSLQVDISKTCELLDWKPPVNVDDALIKTAKAFLENRNTC